MRLHMRCFLLGYFPIMTLCLGWFTIRNLTIGQKAPIGHTTPIVQRKPVAKPQEFSCGDICNVSMTGTPGPFFDEIVKKVDCNFLWAEKIDARPASLPAPGWSDVPVAMQNEFTYQRKVPLSHYRKSGVLDQRYLTGSAEMKTWTMQLVDKWITECKKGSLPGTYGVEETKHVFEGLKHVKRLNGGHVLVVGSENPWLEACALAAGAAKVTTLEYGKITSTHPLIDTMTPDEAREKYFSGSRYDAVLSFSSLEHSGMGRYGDALDAHGDLKSNARSWCIGNPGAGLLLGVPSGPGGVYEDAIVWNAHRLYGVLQYSHLAANWKQEWRADSGGQRVHVFSKAASTVPVNM